jgi:Zn-dependent peptidase ImmA (M78 family)
MKAPVNPEILKWARKSSKITLDKAAKTISKTCKPDRIKEWETPGGKDQPSVKQVEKLARLYRRPIDVFFLPFIPKDFPALKDFRKEKEEGTDTALIFMMREVQEKAEWLSEFLQKTKKKKLDFVGRYNIKSDPALVATDIRKTLGINPNDKYDKPLKYWIEKVEAKSIYVTLSSNYHTRLKLNSDIFKAFVIADKFAPFIFINSDDWDHGQLVTLIHELVHIWIGVSGISNDTEIDVDRKSPHPVEKFCNEVTALVLLPEDELRKFIPDPEKAEYKQIAKAARKIGVNKHTIIFRAKELGLIHRDNNEMIKTANDEWKEFLYKLSQKKKSSGGPNYYIMQLRRSSRAFSNIVMDNYKRGRINGNDASRLLKVKEANFIKFEKYVYKS